jgi:hypothetical protein
MSYCPECLAEYKEGTEECMDCHVALQPGAPPATPAESEKEVMANLVAVRTFHGPTAQLDADLARNILQEEHIPAVLPGETSAEILPGIDTVQLLVREQDAAQASEILKAYLDSKDTSEIPAED